MEAEQKEQEERILKKAAIFITAVSFASCMLLPYFTKAQAAAEDAALRIKEYRTKTEAQRLHMTGVELLEYNNEQVRKESGAAVSIQNGLRFSLPLGVKEDDVEMIEDDLTQTFEIQIPYAGEDYLYEYPVLGDGAHIESLTYDSGRIYGTVKLEMDMVYEVNARFDENYLYIDFHTPQELYDKVVVIDAGHGGEDTGIVKQGIREKDITLDIALKLKELFESSEKTGIGVYYTRMADESTDEELRMELLSKANADLLVSIHANSTESGRISSINGVQAVYDKTQKASADRSKELAQLCLEEVVAETGASDKGLITGDDSYAAGMGEAPAAWVKVGFMTNEEELLRLCSEEYQEKVAKGIYNAILRALQKER